VPFEFQIAELWRRRGEGGLPKKLVARFDFPEDKDQVLVHRELWDLHPVPRRVIHIPKDRVGLVELHVGFDVDKDYAAVEKLWFFYPEGCFDRCPLIPLRYLPFIFD